MSENMLSHMASNPQGMPAVSETKSNSAQTLPVQPSTATTPTVQLDTTTPPPPLPSSTPSTAVPDLAIKHVETPTSGTWTSDSDVWDDDFVVSDTFVAAPKGPDECRIPTPVPALLPAAPTTPPPYSLPPAQDHKEVKEVKKVKETKKAKLYPEYALLCQCSRRVCTNKPDIHCRTCRRSYCAECFDLCCTPTHEVEVIERPASIPVEPPPTKGDADLAKQVERTLSDEDVAKALHKKLNPYDYRLSQPLSQSNLTLVSREWKEVGQGRNGRRNSLGDRPIQIGNEEFKTPRDALLGINGRKAAPFVPTAIMGESFPVPYEKLSFLDDDRWKPDAFLADNDRSTSAAAATVPSAFKRKIKIVVASFKTSTGETVHFTDVFGLEFMEAQNGLTIFGLSRMFIEKTGLNFKILPKDDELDECIRLYGDAHHEVYKILRSLPHMEKVRIVTTINGKTEIPPSETRDNTKEEIQNVGAPDDSRPPSAAPSPQGMDHGRAKVLIVEKLSSETSMRYAPNLSEYVTIVYGLGSILEKNLGYSAYTLGLMFNKSTGVKFQAAFDEERNEPCIRLFGKVKHLVRHLLLENKICEPSDIGWTTSVSSDQKVNKIVNFCYPGMASAESIREASDLSSGPLAQAPATREKKEKECKDDTGTPRENPLLLDISSPKPPKSPPMSVSPPLPQFSRTGMASAKYFQDCLDVLGEDDEKLSNRGCSLIAPPPVLRASEEEDKSVSTVLPPRYPSPQPNMYPSAKPTRMRNRKKASTSGIENAADLLFGDSTTTANPYSSCFSSSSVRTPPAAVSTSTSTSTVSTSPYVPVVLTIAPEYMPSAPVPLPPQCVTILLEKYPTLTTQIYGLERCNLSLHNVLTRLSLECNVKCRIVEEGQGTPVHIRANGDSQALLRHALIKTGLCKA